MKNEKLERLVCLGIIDKYEYDNCDESGNIGKESEYRNTERLVLYFPNDEKLIIDTFCSGCLENTYLNIE